MDKFFTDDIPDEYQNWPGKNNFNKLMYLIIKKCDMETIEHHLEHNISELNQKNNVHLTPFIIAYIGFCYGFIDKNVVNLLLQKGANINETYYGGHTSLSIGVSQIPGSKIEHIEYLLKRGVNIDHMIKNQFSILHYVLVFENLEVMQILLKYGADVNSTSNGISPLMIACYQNYIDGINLLLEYGANVNFINSNNNTALMFACKKNNTEAIRLLLNHGADVTIRDHKGNNALNMYLKKCVSNEHFGEILWNIVKMNNNLPVVKSARKI